MSSEASGRRSRRGLALLAALVGGSPGPVEASEAVPWKPVWLFPIEVPDGTWGAAGTVWRLRAVAGFVLNDPQKGRAYAERTLGSRKRKA